MSTTQQPDIAAANKIQSNQPAFQSVDYSEAQKILTNRSKAAIFLISFCLLIPILAFFSVYWITQYFSALTAKYNRYS